MSSQKISTDPSSTIAAHAPKYGTSSLAALRTRTPGSHLLGRPGVDRAAMRRELALTMRTTGDTRGASAAHAFTLLAFAYADSVDDAVAAAGAPVTVAQDTSDPDDVELLPALNELPYDFHVYGK